MAVHASFTHRCRWPLGGQDLEYALFDFPEVWARLTVDARQRLEVIDRVKQSVAEHVLLATNADDAPVHKPLLQSVLDSLPHFLRSGLGRGLGLGRGSAGNVVTTESAADSARGPAKPRVILVKRRETRVQPEPSGTPQPTRQPGGTPQPSGIVHADGSCRFTFTPGWIAPVDSRAAEAAPSPCAGETSPRNAVPMQSSVAQPPCDLPTSATLSLALSPVATTASPVIDRRGNDDRGAASSHHTSSSASQTDRFIRVLNGTCDVMEVRDAHCKPTTWRHWTRNRVEVCDIHPGIGVCHSKLCSCVLMCLDVWIDVSMLVCLWLPSCVPVCTSVWM